MSELVDALLFQIRAAKLPTPEQEFRFTTARRFRFDLAWTDRKIAAEIDGATWGRKCETCGDRKAGGRHATGSGIESDAEKYSLAAIEGWRVLRLTKATIKSGEALNLLERALS